MSSDWPILTKLRCKLQRGCTCLATLRKVEGRSTFLATRNATIDHFTVICPVTWPLDGNEARVDLVLMQTSLLLLCKTSCSDANEVHLHDKSSKVCIKTRSTPASLPSKGQVAEQTTVKWSIAVAKGLLRCKLQEKLLRVTWP